MQTGNDSGEPPQEGSRNRKSPSLDTAMVLTPEEEQRATRIKNALEVEDEVLAKVFSDMELAIFAIIDEDNIERSLERASSLQAFRMQYSINDSPNELIEFLKRQEELCPGMMLSIDSCHIEDGKGSHVSVMDMSKYYPSRFLDDPKDIRCLIGSVYYQILCTQPDFQSVREGFRQVLEFEGFGWQNISFKAEMKNIDELLSFLPYRRKQIMCLRVPNAAYIMLSMTRPFLSHEERESFCFGTTELQAEFPEPIPHFYLQPNREEAFEKMLSNVRGLLTRRYENQKSFRLG